VRFFTAKGLRVLGSELKWVVLPSLLIALGTFAVQRTLARSPTKDS
jgi:hypothetical protein